MTIFKIPNTKVIQKETPKFDNPLNIDINFYNVYDRADANGKSKLIIDKLNRFIQECVVKALKNDNNRNINVIKSILNDAEELWIKFCNFLGMNVEQRKVFSVAIENVYPELFILWQEGKLSKGKLKNLEKKIKLKAESIASKK